MGNRGKIGGIGFEHEGANWSGFHGLDDRFGFLEGGDAGKGNQSACLEDSFCQFGGARKTMEDGTDIVREIGVNLEGIVEATSAGPIARVDDDVELRILGDFEVAAQEVALAGVVVFFGPAFRRGVKVVESGFSDGRDLRV